VNLRRKNKYINWNDLFCFLTAICSCTLSLLSRAAPNSVGRAAVPTGCVTWDCRVGRAGCVRCGCRRNSRILSVHLLICCVRNSRRFDWKSVCLSSHNCGNVLFIGCISQFSCILRPYRNYFHQIGLEVIFANETDKPFTLLGINISSKPSDCSIFQLTVL